MSHYHDNYIYGTEEQYSSLDELKEARKKKYPNAVKSKITKVSNNPFYDILTRFNKECDSVDTMSYDSMMKLYSKYEKELAKYKHLPSYNKATDLLHSAKNDYKQSMVNKAKQIRTVKKIGKPLAIVGAGGLAIAGAHKLHNDHKNKPGIYGFESDYDLSSLDIIKGL